MRNGPLRRSSLKWAILLALGMVLVPGLLLAGCGGQSSGSTSAVTPSESTTGDNETTAPAAPQPDDGANDTVGEAIIGSTHRSPGRVILSEEAAAFVAPRTFPAYRVAPERTITDEIAARQADRLGLGEPRVYDANTISDGRWTLSFRGQDPDCFTLEDILLDAEIMEKVHAGESLPTLSPEQVRGIADVYLTAVGYGDGLEFEQAGVRESVGTATLGGESRTWVITMFANYGAKLDEVRLLDVGATVDVAPDGRVVAFSHTLQKAEPAEYVTLRPVADAIDDMRAGLGQCPVQAKPGGFVEVTVESIEIAYYAGPPAVRDDYYRPVYVFHVLMADGTRGEWVLSAYDVSKQGLSSDADAG